MASFLQVSLPKLCMHFSPIRVTYPSHFIFLDLLTRTMYLKQYRSWRVSLRRLLHPPVTSSFLDPNIFLATQLSKNLSMSSVLMWNTEFHTRRKRQRRQSVSPSLNIHVFFFSLQNCSTKDSGPKRSRHSPNRICYVNHIDLIVMNLCVCSS